MSSQYSTRCLSCGQNTPNGHTCAVCGYSSAPPPPSGGAARQQDEWECPRCTYKSPGVLAQCGICDCPRPPGPSSYPPAVPVESRPAAPSAAARLAPQPQRNWDCRRCTFENPPASAVCEVCQSPRMGGGQGGGGWQCRRCGLVNPAGTPKDECPACGPPTRVPTPNPRSPPSAAGSPPPPAGSRSPQASAWRMTQSLDQGFRKQSQQTEMAVSEITARCLQANTKFTDSDFPPSTRSLYGDGIKRTEYEWRRPENLHQDGYAPNRYQHLFRKDDTNKLTVIRDDVRAEDVQQGALGDCWFISALSLVATRPHLLDRILITKTISPQGVYALRFFYQGVWQTVLVDDHFPTQHGRLVYARGLRNQLWVPLIEKAYAKLHGSCYSSIHSGQTYVGLSELTGAPCETLHLESRDGKEVDLDIIWATLMSCTQANFLMGASCGRVDNQTEAIYDRIGLVMNHAYALEEALVSDRTRFLLIRNPWGSYSKTEWKGKWSKGCPEWHRNPAVKRELYDRVYANGQQGGGCFWIGWEDFITYFTQIDICKEQQSWCSLTLPNKARCGGPGYMGKGSAEYSYIIKVPKSTWMFLSVVQSSHTACKLNRRQPSHVTSSQSRDWGVNVFEFQSDKVNPATGLPEVPMAREAEGLHLTASLFPRLSLVSNCELLANKCGRNSYYLVVPFSPSAIGESDPPDRSDRKLYKFSFCVYSAHEIQVAEHRPGDGGSLSLARVGMHAMVAQGSQPKTLIPGVVLFTTFKGSSIFIIAVNTNQSKCCKIEMECSVKGLNSTRGALKTVDVVPGMHRQILNILTQAKTYEGYKYSTKYSYQECSPGPRRGGNHEPPVAEHQSIHSPFLIPNPHSR